MDHSESVLKSGPIRSLAGVLLLVVAMGYSAWMMGHEFGAPFNRGYLGSNGARYSIMARNVLRADLRAANYAPLLNAEGQKDLDPYLHHPPLLQWVMALVFRVFGENEDHAREIPFAFTLLNLILLFFLGRRVLGGAFMGGLTAAMGAVLPLTSFYGAHVDVQGSPLMFCILSCVLCYCRWLHTGRSRWYAGAVVFLVIGTLFDWPALYLCVLLPLHYWISRRSQGVTWKVALRKLGVFSGTGFALFAGLVWWLSTAGEAKCTSLYESLLHRSFHPSTFLEIGNPWKYLAGHNSLAEIYTLCPWPFLALLFAGWMLAKLRPSLLRPGAAVHSLWPLFFLGMVHVVIFPFGTLFHDYWIFLFLPWVALAAALALGRLKRLAEGRPMPWRVASGVLALLVLAGVSFAGYRYSMDRLHSEGDELTYRLGKIIHDNSLPGKAVMINAEHYNQPIPSDKDRYVLFKPALSYYSDRVVRGHILDPESFEWVRKLRDDYGYFFFIKAFGKDQARLYNFLKTHFPLLKEVPPGILIFQLDG